ncbi:MAG: transcription-repair coupling factor [Acidimicrobiia bacterium]
MTLAQQPGGDLLSGLFAHAKFLEAAHRLLRGKDAFLPVIDAARGYFLAALAEYLAENGQGPLIVVTAEAREAYRIAADALAFAPKRRSRNGPTFLPVEVLPPWESLPFEHISPSANAMGTRMRVLWRLRSGDRSLRLVVASARAALQRTDPAGIPKEPLLLAPGREVDLSKAADTLVQWGYERTYQVEGRGEFAIRGGILDIWPAGAEFVIRTDFFGDLIEEIKTVSVSTQRTIDVIEEEVAVFPARELRPTDEVRDLARRLLASHPDNAAVWEKFAEGIYFPGMEGWLAWVVPRPATLFELLEGGSIVALMDPAEIRARAEAHVAEEEDLASALMSTWDTGQEHASASSDPSAEAPRLYARPDEAFERFRLPMLAVTSAPQALEDVEPLFEPWPRAFKTSDVAAKSGAYSRKGWTVAVAAGSTANARRVVESFADEEVSVGIAATDDLSELIRQPGLLAGTFSYSEGFVFPDGQLALVTEAELAPSRSKVSELKRAPARWERATRYATAKVSPGFSRALRAVPEESGRGRKTTNEEFLADLEPGDYVVHNYHGIGVYKGLVTLSAGGAERDYLLLEYAGGGRLYVPTYHLDSVSKYSGGEHPRLSRLGGADWAQTKRRARAAAAKVARYLVELYRERSQISGIAFSKDTPWQRELEDSFPYDLTPDQERALTEVKADMESPRPMDRLVCGDVGFGKTEIAVRAAFKAVQDGFQVAVLVPTTLLAQQHLETFCERFEPYPVRVEMLSRFLTPARQRKVIERVASGEVDVIIGTHRLLQKDVRIPKLGLLIVDEEHRFGVAHKEAIKVASKGVDVLTLTATPIPRTLEMALAGIRDVSTIETPPSGRQPVLTYVGEYDEGAVSAAIRRELMRKGQVFYVHNRVRSIEMALEHIRELVPSARVEACHGQMADHVLEKTMMRFYEGEIDVLVTTTIVESGLDIPSVNTLIVERADTLGLAELYQLRGRVGRGKDRAYAYFFYPSRKALSEEAFERLKTIGEHTDLGSGFAIARRDLEIRGAGNLLGEAQSGHIAAVGLDLYVKMVAESVATLESGEVAEASVPVQIDIPVEAYLPKEYVSQESSRLEAYRKLAEVCDEDGIQRMQEEWRDRYGPLPGPALALADLARLKLACQRMGITDCVYAGVTLKLSPLELTELQCLRLSARGFNCVYKPSDSALQVKVDKERCTPKYILSLLAAIETAQGSRPKKTRNRSKKNTNRASLNEGRSQRS